MLLIRVLMPVYIGNLTPLNLPFMRHFSGGKCYRSLWMASNRMDDTGIYLLLNLIF